MEPLTEAKEPTWNGRSIRFTRVKASPHAEERYLQRIENRWPPYSLDERERASCALEALFLSGAWRPATDKEVKKYFLRGQFSPSERVLSTELGCFLVAVESGTMTIVTMCDELSNMMITSRSRERRKRRR